MQGVYLVHPKISNLVAACVGVPSLRNLLLAQSSNSMSLGFTGAEAFGQSESLTTRLKHIITEYPEGPGEDRCACMNYICGFCLWKSACATSFPIGHVRTGTAVLPTVADICRPNWCDSRQVVSHR